MNTKWLDHISQFTKKNSPEILSGIAIGGVIATAFLAARAAVKAAEKDSYRDKHSGSEASPLKNAGQYAKEHWKLYLPAIGSGAATITCIVWANRISVGRYTALAGAYTVLESTFGDYKKHVIKEIGEAKNRKIEDQMMAERVENTPAEVIIMAGGDQLCLESWSGRYFKSDIEKIRRAENDLNFRIINGDMCVSVNEWFDALGLEHTIGGDELGWNVKTKLECVFASHLHPCSGQPALTIRYRNYPVKDYEKAW